MTWCKQFDPDKSVYIYISLYELQIFFWLLKILNLVPLSVPFLSAGVYVLTDVKIASLHDGW